MNLKDKVAIVTGGSSGIGGAIASRYAKEGANIVIAARSLDSLKAKKEELKELGAEVEAVQADVSKEEHVKRIKEKTLERFGKIDILVNAAGMTMVAPSEQLTLENWNKCMDVNSTGTFLMCREVGQEMIDTKRGGKIINITSIVAHAGIAKRAAYAASKGAVRQLTETLALEWGPYNINVNAISPGYVSTPIFQDLVRKGIHNPDLLEARIPLGRLAQVEDIAGPALFLASSESDYVTGVILKVDGGWLVNGHLNIH
ncbi:SDR family NAD(P)-dependent oxidoreductase [Bacillus taeanensis]|uniref:Short-chain dehydrogenase n=1 Tax=Bacillus taeanensis TaxID=273032 RepID=A0A366XTS6_9BACI|nr:glucose 1-dehydrogenase [Bacillus taeanensis]RBW69307.1 short-chain dehydrogenase [Bacillus taeanensis]